MICPFMSGVNAKGVLVKVDCVKHECAKYVQINGVHPQTGVAVADWKCADAWVPILLIEGSQMSRQTGAAVESFRNEMVVAARNALEYKLSSAGEAKWLESR